MTYKPIYEAPHEAGEGTHLVYRFDNGYGASVVRLSLGPLGFSGLGFGNIGSYTEGDEWEVAVIWFMKRKPKGWDGPKGLLPFDLCYDTPITDDVIGHVKPTQLNKLLAKIAALPARKAKK